MKMLKSIVAAAFVMTMLSGCYRKVEKTVIEPTPVVVEHRAEVVRTVPAPGTVEETVVERRRY